MTRDRVRGLLASLGFLELLALFLIGLAALSLLCGVLLTLGAPPRAGGGLLHWSQEAFLGIAGLTGADLTLEGGGIAYEAARSLTAAVAILWPAIVLGVIVFRLFVHTDMFVIRKKLSVLRNPDSLDGNGDFLAIRIYNSSPLQPVHIHFALRLQTYLQHATAGGTRANLPLNLKNPDWPIAERHVPYTIYVPLQGGDLEEGRLCHLQGHPLSTRAELLLYITGDAAELGTTTSELHRIPIWESISYEGFYGVDVKYDGRSWNWEGWDRFDDPRA